MKPKEDVEERGMMIMYWNDSFLLWFLLLTQDLVVLMFNKQLI